VERHQQSGEKREQGVVGACGEKTKTRSKAESPCVRASCETSFTQGGRHTRAPRHAIGGPNFDAGA
jgi:hypothetical protein